MCRTRLYHIWATMKDRCKNKNASSFYNYGGRGIGVDPRWDEFINFKADMYRSYLTHVKKYGIRDTSLDRRDNNGPYSKDNCRWVTKEIQSRNTRRNRKISMNGEVMVLQDWADRYRISSATICTRVNRLGWSFEDAIKTPSKGNWKTRLC